MKNLVGRRRQPDPRLQTIRAIGPSSPSTRERGWAFVIILVGPGVVYEQMEFEVFYQEQRAGLVRLCFLLTLDVELAADAAQEAMLRAFTRWDTLRDEAPVGWVRRVALNLCRSRWRRAQKELHLLPRLYAVPAVPADVDVDLLASLRALPARQREAVVLRYWSDLSLPDCAAVMAVSVGAVNQHLARARAALRELETPQSEEEMA